MSCDSESDYEDIRPLFPKRQWLELSRYDKSSYRSAKENYHAMQAAGLAPKPPHFLKESEEKRKRKGEGTKKQTNKQRQRKEDSNAGRGKSRRALRPMTRRERLARLVLPPPLPLLRRRLQRAAKPSVPDVVELAEAVEDTRLGGESAGRYPKRSCSRKSYAVTEDDLLDDGGDDLYCDSCEKSPTGWCTAHRAERPGGRAGVKKEGRREGSGDQSGPAETRPKRVTRFALSEINF